MSDFRKKPLPGGDGTAIGVDLILNTLAAQLMESIEYLPVAYGRAMQFKEIWGNKGLVNLPKVLLPNGDYKIVLPDDTNSCQSYFIAVKGEDYKQFDRVQMGQILRQFAVVFWGTLGENGVPGDLETIKFDFIKVLQKSGNIRNIDSYQDERYELVFPEFAYWLSRSVARDTDKKQADTQWLTFPNSGFRMLFTISYIQPC